MRLYLSLSLNIEYLKVILCCPRYLGFEREDSGIGVHERRVGGDRAPERLHGHGHVDDDDAVLRGGLADADVLLRLHGDMGEGDELRGDAQAGEREGLAHGDGGVGRRHGDGRRCRDLSLLGLGEEGGGGDGWSLHSDLI